MWDAVGIIGLLGTLVAVIVCIIMAIKKNPIWKRWLAVAGIAFVMFMVGAVNAPTDNTQPASSSPTQDQNAAITEKDAKVTSNPAPKSEELSNTGISSNVTITVQGFEATDSIGDNQFSIAKAQGVFKVVTLSLTNNQKDAIVVDSESFKLMDGQAREFSDSSDAQMALACSMGDHPEAFTFTELNPGMTITGAVIFDVPQDAKGFYLKAHGGMTGSEIKLKVE